MNLFTIWKNCTVGKNCFGELPTYVQWVQALTVGDSCKAAISKPQIGYVGMF